MIKTVVAALLLDRGRILACRRRDDQSHAGKWEFPGGKVEPGESEPDALRRELREELGIEATIGKLITRYEFSYPRKPPIELAFYLVQGFAGPLDGDFFAQTLWATPSELPALDFLEGDVDFVRRLAAGEFDLAAS